MTELKTGRVRPVVPPLKPPSARQRLLRAVIDQSSVVGFHDVLVNDLCEICGISRRTFYNYFPDVPELFLVAYGQVDAELRHTLRTAWTASGHERGAVIAALVSFACADPVRADAFFVQALAAGRPVADRRQRTLEWCGALLTSPQGDGLGAVAPRRPSLSLEVACGGAWDVVRTRVAAGDVVGLRRDAPALVAATAEYGRAVRPARPRAV